MTRCLPVLLATLAATGCSTEDDFPVRGGGGHVGDFEPGDDDGPDAGAVEAPAVDPDCTTDSVLPDVSYGQFATPSISDFAPLCDGLVAIGDRTGNQVSVRWARTGAQVAAHALTAAPDDLELDGPRGVVFATLSGQDGLARVNLADGVVTPIALADEALDLAITDAGALFATLAGENADFDRPVVHVDGATGEVLGTSAVDNRSHFLVWDEPRSQLIAGVVGLSPSGLRRYAFDDAAETLTLTQERWNAGTNGEDLAISSSGRLAFACGGGNVDGYTIVDFSSSDLESSAGEWNTGAYPRSAAFSPDGQYLAATNGGELLIYDVASHVELARYRPDLIECSYSSLRRVEWSRGGRYVFALSDCGFDDDAGVVAWMRFDPS